MDNIKGKVLSLQEALLGLSFQSEEGGEGIEEVLLGKILTYRNFRRYIVIEIVTKTWHLQVRVQTEKLGDNIYKFKFGWKENRDKIFRGRPWSLNDAHLILKEWLKEKALSEISFKESTFFHSNTRSPSSIFT